MNWKDDKRWSDRFMPQIKQILGEFLLKEPPAQEDAEHNTDLISLKMDSLRIACRIRKYDMLEKYPDDITIRSGRPSGTKTELAKIVEGWGDYLFYGFADKSEIRIVKWRICDLKVLRLFFSKCLFTGNRQWHEIPNHDKSSFFYAFDVKKISGLVVAQNDDKDPF